MVFISWNKTQNILHNVSETDAKCCLFSVVGHFVKKKNGHQSEQHIIKAGHNPPQKPRERSRKCARWNVIIYGPCVASWKSSQQKSILPPHMVHTRNSEELWEGGKTVRSDHLAGLTWMSDASLCGHGTLEKTLCFWRKNTARGHFNLSASPYQSIHSFSFIGLRGFDAMTFCSRVERS